MDEIADAADVGRMTVFNHFPRKEDMFFDQEMDARNVVIGAVEKREADLAPIEALRLLAPRLIKEDAKYIRFFDGSRQFVETVLASDVLKARARAIRDDTVQVLAQALAGSVGQPSDDPDAYLAASLLLSAWTVAFTRAHEIYRQRADSKAAEATFLAIVEKGTIGVVAAMAGTPYV